MAKIDVARELTPDEKKFVQEAHAGNFGVLLPPEYDPPIAMGACGCGNLFSMQVVEIDDPYNGGSIYRLPQADYQCTPNYDVRME
jgi:hypothetical protein